MNETMNQMFKKDLPNLHDWCEEYAKRTGVKIYAGNPPIGLVLEYVMGQVKALQEQMNLIAPMVRELVTMKEQEILPKEEPKKEKSKK